MHRQIILFDGVCNLCNGFVDFIIRFDKKRIFKLGALQSVEGLRLLKEKGLDDLSLSSVVLITNKAVFKESRAVLEILKALGGLWSIFYVFIILPAFFRDAMYRWIAKNRYHWFGQKDSCRMPDANSQDRFI